MEISDSLRKQMEDILKTQGVKQMPIERLIKQQLSPELAEMVIKSGRLTPCAHFCVDISTSNKVTGLCSRGHKLDCLNCPDYDLAETPGDMGDEGTAQFEYGHVLHLVKHIESDGYYRSAITLCGREIDEGNMAVEIYPDDISDIPKDAICKKCAAKLL